MGSSNLDIPETSVLDNATNKPKKFFKQKFILVQETWQKLKRLKWMVWNLLNRE